jgi:S-adenosylmethionine hydrolase
MAYITLLSDFGLQDASAAIAKGTLMQHAPKRKVLDITHDATTFDIAQAAYLLASVYKKYSTGTCHMLLLDIFSEPRPKLLLCEYDGHYFFTTDNGALQMALQANAVSAWLVLELSAGLGFKDWLTTAAKVITQLDNTTPENLGLPTYVLTEVAVAQPTSDIVPCEILHVDEYENVVLNITKQQFAQMGNNRRFRLEFMQVEDIGEISSNYNDVRAGYKLARFNNSGHLEICINRGKAASLFGLNPGNSNNGIKLIFE